MVFASIYVLARVFILLAIFTFSFLSNFVIVFVSYPEHLNVVIISDLLCWIC
jgi:hypothetical protein